MYIDKYKRGNICYRYLVVAKAARSIGIRMLTLPALPEIKMLRVNRVSQIILPIKYNSDTGGYHR